MNCLHPITIKSPESRLLRRCIKEGRSFEYYYKHANVRRNLLLDPVPLINSSYEYYAPNSHPPVRFQKVACGHCDNCLKRRVNDYFVRSYFEYIDTNSNGGSTYFVTLTFADELLPRLLDGTPCFDSEIIKKFLKRLRIYLLRKYSYSLPLKYFITSEYGGEYGRPHHHGLFFLPSWDSSISNLFLFRNAVANSWTKIDDRQNWYANDDPSLFDLQRIDVQQVNDLRGIRYVSKYVGKQIGSESFDNRKIEHRWKRNHWQSIGFGSCLPKYISPDEFRDGLVSIDSFKYSLPLYYQNLLKREFYCWSDDGSIIYQPTAFARDSVRNFSMNLLQEYKDLSCLMADFPKAPSSLYDPYNLALLDNWLSKYSGFEFANDFSFNDPARFGDLSSLVEDIQVFFNAVDDYYKPKYAAQAEMYRKHQQIFYEKKTHRR